MKILKELGSLEEIYKNRVWLNKYEELRIKKGFIIF